MTRLALAVATVLAASPTLFAMRASESESSLSRHAVLLGAARHPKAELTRGTAASPREAQLVVTDSTEVKLDGKKCNYTEVPTNVEAVFIEVADDGKTILRIHFRKLGR